MAKPDLEMMLATLRADFTSVRGASFAHFFCPILHVDEDVELCEGHIVGQAFPNTARTRVVQRKDVDGFYGSHFEADFAAILYKERGTPASVLLDRKSSRQFEISITAGGELVPHFFAKGRVPERFTGLEVHDGQGQTILLGLRKEPEAVLRETAEPWEMWVAKDIRLPALVSLIKAAYLTLFSLLGYRYALSSGGALVGPEMLGRFFRQSEGKSRRAVLNEAHAYFRPYVHMVRPVIKAPASLAGTVTDRTLFLCRSGPGQAWSVIVFVRTSRQLHAVLLPVAECESEREPFLRFLRDGMAHVTGSFMRLERDHWAASQDVLTFGWPKGKDLLD